MANYLFDYRSNFSGGERDAVSPDNLRESEVMEMINLDPDISGGVIQRPGMVVCHNTINARKHRIMEFEYLSGTTRVMKRLELIDGKIIDPLTPDAGQTYKVLWSTGLGESLDYEVFANKLYILTGTDLLVYDGTTITSATNAEAGSMIAHVKKCRYLIKKGDRMIYAGHSENPNWILYSERLNPTYVKDTSSSPATTINPITALSDDGDVITGLEVYNDNILIFKRRSIFYITGVDPMTQWQMKRINSHTGTVSHRTVEKVSGSLFFLGFDLRVYRLYVADSGEVTIQYISSNKEESLSKITLHTDPYYTTVNAIFHDGKYMLSAPTQGNYLNNDTVFVFHVNIWQKNGGNECWCRYTGVSVTDMLLSNDGQMYMASTGGKTYNFSKSALTDNGAHINCALQPKSFNGVLDADTRHLALNTKKFRSGKILFRQFETESSAVNVYHRVDYDDDDGKLIPLSADLAGIFDEGDFDEVLFDFNDVTVSSFPISKRGVKCLIRLTSDSTVPNNKIAIYGIGTKFKLKKLK